MAKAATKLKVVEPEPVPLPPLRKPLADAIDKVAAVREQMAAVEAELETARNTVREAAAAVEAAEKAVADAPALERRAKREELRLAQEHLQDWTDHHAELRAKSGDDGKVHDFPVGLPAALAQAESKVRAERADLLKSHPHTWELLKRHEALRLELHQVAENLRKLSSINAIPEAGKFWDCIPSEYRLPPPEPALVNWIERLMTDPAAELEA